MKTFYLTLFALLGLLPAAQAQYSLTWNKIAGGGGTSSGGNYQVNGTIGQPDASGALAGGGYSLTGGFWSLISSVPAAGVPSLVITPGGANTVIVSWPATGSYTLQQNGNLTGGSWTTSGYTVTTINGTNSIAIMPPAGNLFFRLVGQ